MNKSKEILRKLKLVLPAGEINPALVGKNLAPTGINLNQFINEYNQQTAKDLGRLIPAEIIIYEDRSFVFTTKTPPTSFLIKEKLKINKSAAKPGHEVVGYLNQQDLIDIAKIKLPDMNTTSINQIVKMVEGSARSMGVKVDH
ncbi:50S ribosomal protein L11 [Pediococcus acidilactici]